MTNRMRGARLAFIVSTVVLAAVVAPGATRGAEDHARRLFPQRWSGRGADRVRQSHGRRAVAGQSHPTRRHERAWKVLLRGDRSRLEPRTCTHGGLPQRLANGKPRPNSERRIAISTSRCAFPDPGRPSASSSRNATLRICSRSCGRPIWILARCRPRSLALRLDACLQCSRTGRRPRRLTFSSSARAIRQESWQNSGAMPPGWSMRCSGSNRSKRDARTSIFGCWKSRALRCLFSSISSASSGTL